MTSNPKKKKRRGEGGGKGNEDLFCAESFMGIILEDLYSK